MRNKSTHSLGHNDDNDDDGDDDDNKEYSMSKYGDDFGCDIISYAVCDQREGEGDGGNEKEMQMQTQTEIEENFPSTAASSLNTSSSYPPSTTFSSSTSSSSSSFNSSMMTPSLDSLAHCGIRLDTDLHTSGSSDYLQLALRIHDKYVLKSDKL